MPEIVAKGRTDVRACALCHYPNGQGRPENGPVSGLPAAYIVQQLMDFKNGTRVSSEPRMGPPANMVRLAKAMTAEDIAESIFWATSLPEHVNINKIQLMATTQAIGPFIIHREG